MDEVLECPVCCEAFDYDAHRPLLLPVCGHTICSSCLNSGLLNSCPEDRTPIGDCALLPANILALRSIEARARSQSLDRQQLLPGFDSDVKLISSDDVQLLEKVGEGGSGEVWRASYKHKQVAVKIFSMKLPGRNSSAKTCSTNSSSTSPSGTQSCDPLLHAFMREVELLQVVSEDSLYCCRMFGCTVKDDRPCIVMKWFGCGHLEAPPGGYDLPSALQWGLSIAKALSDVHALGIVIADLKPENVLISDQGDPVLADFGISRRVSTTMATMTQGRTAMTAQGIKGTPYYMAPEQWQAGRLTNRTDVWSFGCLLLHLLTGSPPWLGLNMFQVMGAVAMQRSTPQLPNDLPGWLAALLQSCFAYEPSARPSAQQLVDILKAHTFLLAGQAADIISSVAAAQLDPATDHTLTAGLPASSGRPSPYQTGSTYSSSSASVLSSTQQPTPSSTIGSSSATGPIVTSSLLYSNPPYTDSSSLPTKVLLERLHQAYAGSSPLEPSAPPLHPAAAPAAPPNPNPSSDCYAGGSSLEPSAPAMHPVAAPAAQSKPSPASDELIAKLACSALGRQAASAQCGAAVPAGVKPAAVVSTSTAVQPHGACEDASRQGFTPGRQSDTSYMEKSAACWVQQLRSTDPRAQAAAAAALHNELLYARTTGGQALLVEALDRIITADGISALTALLLRHPTSQGRGVEKVQLLVQRQAVALLDTLLQHKPAVRAEVAATGVGWQLREMVSGSDTAAAALSESALKLLSSSW